MYIMCTLYMCTYTLWKWHSTTAKCTYQYLFTSKQVLGCNVWVTPRFVHSNFDLLPSGTRAELLENWSGTSPLDRTFRTEKIFLMTCLTVRIHTIYMTAPISTTILDKHLHFFSENSPISIYTTPPRSNIYQGVGGTLVIFWGCPKDFCPGL